MLTIGIFVQYGGVSELTGKARFDELSNWLLENRETKELDPGDLLKEHVSLGPKPSNDSTIDVIAAPNSSAHFILLSHFYRTSSGLITCSHHQFFL